MNDFSKDNADKVVKEIKDAGGKAIANYDNVTNGFAIVKQAMAEWGRIDSVFPYPLSGQCRG